MEVSVDPQPRSVESRSYPLKQFLSKVADKGAVARERLVAWGINVPQNDRLSQAVSLLRAAAQTGLIPPAPDGVAPVLRAAWVAADFSDIASSLPQPPVRSVRDELTVACTGEMWPPKGARQPLQLESQHWIGAVTRHSGMDIEYAYASSKRPIKIPEFFVRHEDQRIAIEVKRPESDKRIAASVEESSAKFADHSECWGAIVLELTDCTMPAHQDEFDSRSAELFAKAHGALWDADNAIPRVGFERVIYLGAVYRGAWATSGPEGARLQLMGTAKHNGYGGLRGSKQDLVSHWFQNRANQWYDGVIARVGE